MKNLDLNNWLRYFLAGAIVVIIWTYISYDQESKEVLNLTKTQLTDFQKGITGISISLIIGAILYSLHRALIYPLIYQLFLVIFSITTKNIKFKWELLIPFRPSAIEFEFAKKRWENSILSETPTEKERCIQKISEWGGQIHFLYCISWALLLTHILIKRTDVDSYEWICFTFCLFLVSAIIHHLRYMFIENKILSE